MFGIIIAILALVLVNGLYILATYRIVSKREEKDLYQIITMSFMGHFANWGVAEWYLINGYWYILGISYFPSNNMLYWAMAWMLAVYPFAIGMFLIVFYFVTGTIEVRNRLMVHPKQSYPGISTASEMVDLINRKISSLHRMMLFTVLSIGVGWGTGNIIQDRLCGALCLISAKVEYRPIFDYLYFTFMGDPIGALIKWILPILIFSILSVYIIYLRKA